jgi:hypothetical protein
MRFLFRGRDLEGEADLADDALVLQPKKGAPIRIPFPDIDAALAADYRLKLTLHPPEPLELYYLGPRYEEFCSLFFEKRNAALARELFLADRKRIESFQGRFARPGLPPMDGRIDLFPRTIVFFPKVADPHFVRIADLTAVRGDKEHYLVELHAGDIVTVHYLGLRFEEFQERVRRTREAMEKRCARMLDSLSPGLGALGPRLLDGNILREDEAGPLWPKLESLVCLGGERTETYRHLRSLAKGPVWLGIQETGGDDLDELHESSGAHRIWYYVSLGPLTAQEVVSEEDHATYFFRADPPAINRAWVQLQFRKDVLLNPSKYPAAVRKLPHLREVTAALAGRAIHNDRWAEQVHAVLAKTPRRG